jgi:hypothetical protein
MGVTLVPGYRETRQLGAGRSGRVFLATYRATGAHVAIKYLNATLRRDTGFMARYRAEMPRLVELDDPGVVTYYEYVETGGRAAVVTELVDGVPLRTLLAKHGALTPEAALALLKGVLLGLAAVHGQGLAHRDVSPANLLVRADGTAKLTDVGVAVHPEEPGTPAGSPPYMAPELWASGAAGAGADLYAAACVLFECTTGRPPFAAPDLAVLREGHLSAAPPVEAAPDRLRDLLRRGLAKDPAIRYGSARSFAAELEEDAVAGFGPGWEQRGRRSLAELATSLALRFPLAGGQAATGRGRAGTRTGPRAAPPRLWLVAAILAAVVAGVLLSDGRPPDPAAYLIPSHDTPRASPSPQPPGPDAADPRPTDAAAARPRRSGKRPPGPRSPDRTRASSEGSAAPRPSGGTRQPSDGAPARRPGGPSVREASIVRWTGTAGAVTVTADGTGPVRLSVSYTRRDGDGPLRTVHRRTTTLSGSTAYRAQVGRDPGPVACGGHAHFGVVVLTDPAAANGPQVREVGMTGPPCPADPPLPEDSGPPERDGTRTPEAAGG